VYYPTYYAPLYPSYYYGSTFLPSYVSSVVVPEPVVEYYPADAYVSSGQYASVDGYAGYGGTVAAPDVAYSDGYVQDYPQEGQYAYPQEEP